MLEIDGGVVALGRQRLGVDRIPGLTVRVGDARARLTEQQAGSYDLVVGDAFGGMAVPWHLTTREVAEQIRDALRPDGVYAVNVIDYQPDRFARAEIATLRSVFEHVALLGAPATLAGEAGGNHVIVASRRPLPLRAIGEGLAQRGAWLAADEAATARFAGSARVLTDDRAPVDQLVTTYRLLNAEPVQLGRVGQPQLAPGPLVEGGRAEPDHPARPGAQEDLHRLRRGRPSRPAGRPPRRPAGRWWTAGPARPAPRRTGRRPG